MEFLNNPFSTLGATMRDDRRRLMDLAEEKSLVLDEVRVREAAAILANPRRRLTAEIGWLPGLGPKRISEVISTLEREPAKVRTLGSLPNLVRANLLADGLIRAVEKLPQREVALWITELADAHDEIDAEQTIAALNEERSVAGFPAISDLQSVETEFQGRRLYYRQATNRALDKLPAPSRVEVVTIAVDEATDNGRRQAPILIDDLVDSFEVKAQEFLETQTKKIAVLVQSVRNAADSDEGHAYIEDLITQLEKVVKNWDQFAQPIQVSARSRGISHSLSHEVAGEIRSLAVDLFNLHDLLDISKRLTALQQEVFAEVDRVVEQSEEDSSTLDEITEQRIQFFADIEACADSWKREITYEVDIGVMFKYKLRISPDGVRGKDWNIPLEEINRVRWGGTRHSISGIPTGTTYNVFVGGQHGGENIKIRKRQIYSEFIDRLWKAVGVRLLTEMLKGLRAGKSYQFGTAVVTDHGIELVRSKLFGANERVHCKWADLAIGSGPGMFYIAKKDEKKVAVELPYQDTDNVHILEVAMRVFWERASPRLSDLLKKEN